MSTDLDRKIQRERQGEITKQLGELRAILRDLEGHLLPIDVPVERRITHFRALDDVRAKIYQLDLDYIKLVTSA